METAEKRSGLGRGLRALLSSGEKETEALVQDLTDEEVESRLRNVDIAEIFEDPNQPRKHFDAQALSQLQESIREVGILQPLLVREIQGQFHLIAGERRLRAAKAIALESVPVLIVHVNELQKLKISLIENIQREALNPLEEAKAFKRLSNEFSLTQEDISAQVGKSRAYVANSMRLLSLPESVQNLLLDQKLTRGHARAILSLRDEAAQIKVANKAVAEGLAVREIDDLIEHMRVLESKGTKPAKYKPNVSIGVSEFKFDEFATLVDQMIRLLGVRVNISTKGNSGKIEIHFKDREELERLVNQIIDA